MTISWEARSLQKIRIAAYAGFAVARNVVNDAELNPVMCIHVRGADNHLQLMSLPPARDLRCGERLMKSAAWRWHGTR
jgi:hypothetical protein